MYIHSDMGIADDRVGDRMKTSYCYNTMRKMGIRLAAGSDLPIESPKVMEAIQVSVTRKTFPDGRRAVGIRRKRSMFWMQ